MLFLFYDSLAGHLKFWKKKGVGIEFAKHFRSHLGPIEGLAVSSFYICLACVLFTYSFENSNHTFSVDTGFGSEFLNHVEHAYGI